MTLDQIGPAVYHGGRAKFGVLVEIMVDYRGLGSDARKMVQEVLGYLNFSSGVADPRFLKDLNELFGLIEGGPGGSTPAWRALGELLSAGLEELRGTCDAFRHVEQAAGVLPLVFEAALPGYQHHHRDLLAHQTEERLFRPFFIGRVCEAVLRQGGPWHERERIVSGALSQLNDYLGHRPVAVLHSAQKIEPYPHERVRPIPLYIRGAGATVGRYHDLIERALAILEATDPSLLFQAWFDPRLLDELAVDPRAYDFDHPINKRPNYLFGQWDLGRLDNAGNCRRFVLQEVSLEAMMARVDSPGRLPREELLVEAAAVLAGTMLMGSGVSGNRPDAHDSDTTLATLVQHIASYRDAFYEQLLGRLSGTHSERLRAEAVRLRQPLGGARQEFNQHLARCRAEQLQRVHLAQVFARMGHAEAAARQLRVVPVASARMQCDIRCRLTAAHLAVEQGELARAAQYLPEIEDLLHRAIACGAIVDPWNVLGFGAQYSLFPALENTVHDHRVDELIDIVGEVFDLCVRIEKEAAAAGNGDLEQALSQRLERIGRWWDKYASIEVSSVEGISGEETRESADHVAAALRAWHEAGTAAGDLAFWRDHAEQFRSPKAYALVVEALLEQRDPVAAMALLVQWLSQAEEIPLVEETYSFHDLALRWMEDLWPSDEAAADRSAETQRRWDLSRKFLDYLEANAEQYGEVPKFELATAAAADAAEVDALEEEEYDELYGAAYEGMVYRDSTGDGIEGETLEGGEDLTDFELVGEAEEIVTRISFLGTLAQLWKLAAVASAPGAIVNGERDQVLAGWLERATTCRHRLLGLLDSVHRYRIPPPRGTHEALLEYDRRRAIKEALLEQIINTCVQTVDAAVLIRAAMRRQPAGGLEDWEEPAARVLGAVLGGDPDDVHDAWPTLMDALDAQPLLYVALARGGNPRRIVASRSLQCVLRRLLAYLPRLGLLSEATALIETVQDMELDHPVGPGAITEFDQMFRIGCRAIAQCLVVSSETWPSGGKRANLSLIECLEKTIEALLRIWLVHSRGVRLSVLETVQDRERWRELRQFIERYGGDLFTQKFMNLGNLRAILHQGVESYLTSLEEEPDADEELRLLQDLDGPLAREDAVRWLTVILEAVVENYAEYIDYNSTTTQSDRGELLYTLLDFLRLRASYERMAWNLQPVNIAHEVMVRLGHDKEAETWREAVTARTKEMADEHLKRFARLVSKYGMRLPSVADRLGERFVRPLAVDQLRALVRPAIEAMHSGEPSAAFTRLELEIGQFTAEASGAGFELPSWLEALEQEAERVELDAGDDEELPDPYLNVPQIRLSAQQARREVQMLTSER